jgi:ornithine carbamoyltransferase
MSPLEEDAVLEEARRLKRAALAGSTKALLRGKKLGLLSEADDDDVALFCSAAAELGAHVSHVRPSLSDLSTPEKVRRTSQLLGRLYDAVECQGMAGGLVEQLSNDAGVPVYDGITGARHPTARLAEQLGTDTSPQANRRFILQAVLLSTIT